MIPNLTRIVDEIPVVRQPCPAGWSYDGCFGHDNEFLASCYRNKGMGLVVLLSLSSTAPCPDVPVFLRGRM